MHLCCVEGLLLHAAARGLGWSPPHTLPLTGMRCLQDPLAQGPVSRQLCSSSAPAAGWRGPRCHGPPGALCSATRPAARCTWTRHTRHSVTCQTCAGLGAASNTEQLNVCPEACLVFDVMLVRVSGPPFPPSLLNPLGIVLQGRAPVDLVSKELQPFLLAAAASSSSLEQQAVRQQICRQAAAVELPPGSSRSQLFSWGNGANFQLGTGGSAAPVAGPTQHTHTISSCLATLLFAHVSAHDKPAPNANATGYHAQSVLCQGQPHTSSCTVAPGACTVWSSTCC
jgi:hypothetical protein